MSFVAGQKRSGEWWAEWLKGLILMINEKEVEIRAALHLGQWGWREEERNNRVNIYRLARGPEHLVHAQLAQVIAFTHANRNHTASQS